MRPIIWILFGLLLGLGLTVDGFDKLTESKASCGYQKMGRGDSCQEFGSTVEVRSYDEQRSMNRSEGLVKMVGGGLIVFASLGYGVVCVVRMRELSRE